MINKYLLSGFIISICLFFTSGCSTIIRGISQSIMVKSIPSGAEIMLNGQRQTTPSVFRIKGKSGYTIVAYKNGYKTSYKYVKGDFRFVTTIFGNSILWLLPLAAGPYFMLLYAIPIGIAIDYATGSAYEMPKQITIPMEKE